MSIAELEASPASHCPFTREWCMTRRSWTFSGGGVCAFAYVGALRALHDMYGIDWGSGIPRRLESVAGASIGSLFALTIVLGYSLPELETVMHDTLPPSQLFSIDVSCLFTPSTPALDDGMRVRAKVLHMLATKVVGGVERAAHMTLAQLQEGAVGGTAFMCNAVDILSGSALYLDAHTAPNMLVVDAVCASMGVPLVFPPIVLPRVLVKHTHDCRGQHGDASGPQTPGPHTPGSHTSGTQGGSSKHDIMCAPPTTGPHETFATPSNSIATTTAPKRTAGGDVAATAGTTARTHTASRTMLSASSSSALYRTPVHMAAVAWNRAIEMGGRHEIEWHVDVIDVNDGAPDACHCAPASGKQCALPPPASSIDPHVAPPPSLAQPPEAALCHDTLEEDGGGGDTTGCAWDERHVHGGHVSPPSRSQPDAPLPNALQHDACQGAYVLTPPACRTRETVTTHSSHDHSREHSRDASPPFTWLPLPPLPPLPDRVSSSRPWHTLQQQRGRRGGRGEAGGGEEDAKGGEGGSSYDSRRGRLLESRHDHVNRHTKDGRDRETALLGGGRAEHQSSPPPPPTATHMLGVMGACMVESRHLDPVTHMVLVDGGLEDNYPLAHDDIRWGGGFVFSLTCLYGPIDGMVGYVMRLLDLITYVCRVSNWVALTAPHRAASLVLNTGDMHASGNHDFTLSDAERAALIEEGHTAMTRALDRGREMSYHIATLEHANEAVQQLARIADQQMGLHDVRRNNPNFVAFMNHCNGGASQRFSKSRSHSTTHDTKVTPPHSVCPQAAAAAGEATARLNARRGNDIRSDTRIEYDEISTKESKLDILVPNACLESVTYPPTLHVPRTHVDRQPPRRRARSL